MLPPIPRWHHGWVVLPLLFFLALSLQGCGDEPLNVKTVGKDDDKSLESDSKGEKFSLDKEGPAAERLDSSESSPCKKKVHHMVKELTKTKESQKERWMDDYVCVDIATVLFDQADDAKTDWKLTKAQLAKENRNGKWQTDAYTKHILPQLDSVIKADCVDHLEKTCGKRLKTDAKNDDFPGFSKEDVKVYADEEGEGLAKPFPNDALDRQEINQRISERAHQQEIVDKAQGVIVEPSALSLLAGKQAEEAKARKAEQAEQKDKAKEQQELLQKPPAPPQSAGESSLLALHGKSVSQHQAGLPDRQMQIPGGKFPHMSDTADEQAAAEDAIHLRNLAKPWPADARGDDDLKRDPGEKRRFRNLAKQWPVDANAATVTRVEATAKGRFLLKHD